MLAAMWKTDRGGAWEVARVEAQRQVRKAVDVARCVPEPPYSENLTL